jgi:hypothetical protein
MLFVEFTVIVKEGKLLVCLKPEDDCSGLPSRAFQKKGTDGAVGMSLKKATVPKKERFVSRQARLCVA